MNFEPSEDQRQVHDSVKRLLADHCSFEHRRAIAATPAGRSAELFGRLAGLGLTALRVPEQHGGLAGRMEDLLHVAMAAGAALLPEPMLGSAVLATTALAQAPDAPIAVRLLPQLACGDLSAAWADDEAGAQHADCWVQTRADRQGNGWVLRGSKRNVLQGDSAGAFIVTARVAGEADDPAGVAMFVVDAGAAGLGVRAHRLVDETPAAEVVFDATPATPLGDPHDTPAQVAALAATRAAGIAWACADMTGAAEAAFDLATGYLNVRKQFGRLIGENQALRHKAAEMLVSLETARSMAMAAAVAADAAEHDEAVFDSLRAKLIVGRHARAVCINAVQCHGGIGMTEEYAVGHLLRRVHVLDQLFGDVDTQARRLAELERIADTH